MFCSKCGAEYNEGTLFCPKCGMNLQGNVPTGNVPNKFVKEKKKWPIAVIVTLLAIGGTGVVLWQSGMLGGENDDHTANVMNDAIAGGYDEDSTVEELLADMLNRLEEESQTDYNTVESNDSYVSTMDSEQTDMVDGESESGAEEEIPISLVDWVESDEVKEITDSMDSEGDGMKIEFKADGEDVLVMSYTYENQLDLSDEEAKKTVEEYFDSALEEQASTFTNMRDDINDEYKLSVKTIRIEYINADGSLIFSKDIS